MRTRAPRRLAFLPLGQAPLAGPLLVALALGADAFLVVLAVHAGSSPASAAALRRLVAVFLFTAGIPAFFMMMVFGPALRLLARPESRLLPGFGKSLAAAGAFWGIVLWGVPAVLAALFFPPAAVLSFAGLGFLLLVWGLLVTAWPLPRGGFLIVLGFVAYGFLPPSGRALLLALALSPATGLGALVLSAVLLRLLARRLFAPSDPPEVSAPLSAAGMMGGRPSGARLADARGARPSRFMQRLDGWITAPNTRRLERRLEEIRAGVTPRRRVRVVRLLLMPSENPRGWLVRLAFFLLFFVYLIPVLDRSSPVKGFGFFLYGYVVLAGCGALSLVPFARERMKRHLAELYLTLGVEDTAGFKAVVADAHLGLLPGVILLTLTLTGVVSLVLAPARLPVVLATAAVVVPSLALFLLAVTLHVPARPIPRVLFGLILSTVSFFALPLALGLVGLLGVAAGLSVLAVLGASVGFGTWRASRRAWIEIPPDFDAPDPRLPA